MVEERKEPGARLRAVPAAVPELDYAGRLRLLEDAARDVLMAKPGELLRRHPQVRPVDPTLALRASEGPGRSPATVLLEAAAAFELAVVVWAGRLPR